MGLLNSGMLNNAAVLGLIKTIKSIDETEKSNNQQLAELNNKLDRLIELLDNNIK